MVHNNVNGICDAPLPVNKNNPSNTLHSDIILLLVLSVMQQN